MISQVVITRIVGWLSKPTDSLTAIGRYNMDNFL